MNIDEILDRCSKTAAWHEQPITGLNQRNDIGDTPLHTASSWGELEPVRVLLAHGADVKAKGDKGNSVLFNAINGGNSKVVQFLLNQGADVFAKNEWGRLPLQYACNVSASKEIIDILKKSMK